jgi:hypothetical protein
MSSSAPRFASSIARCVMRRVAGGWSWSATVTAFRFCPLDVPNAAKHAVPRRNTPTSRPVLLCARSAIAMIGLADHGSHMAAGTVDPQPALLRRHVVLYSSGRGDWSARRISTNCTAVERANEAAAYGPPHRGVCGACLSRVVQPEGRDKMRRATGHPLLRSAVLVVKSANSRRRGLSASRRRAGAG